MEDGLLEPQWIEGLEHGVRLTVDDGVRKQPPNRWYHGDTVIVVPARDVEPFIELANHRFFIWCLVTYPRPLPYDVKVP